MMKVRPRTTRKKAHTDARTIKGKDKPTTGRKGREKSKMKATQGSRTRSNAENGRTRSTAGKNASKSKAGKRARSKRK